MEEVGEEGGKTRSRSRERMPTELPRLEWEEALRSNGEVRSLGPATLSKGKDDGWPEAGIHRRRGASSERGLGHPRVPLPQTVQSQTRPQHFHRWVVPPDTHLGEMRGENTFTDS